MSTHLDTAVSDNEAVLAVRLLRASWSIIAHKPRIRRCVNFVVGECW